MPVISKIGSRSLKIRLVYGVIFLVLILGAVTMIYPLTLMLSGSVKSEADSISITPYPKYWFDDLELFRKYVESKHNADFNFAIDTWGREIRSWRKLEKPTEQQSQYLEDFLAWRDECRWWWLGHSRCSVRQMLPKNAREFRALMYDRYKEIGAFEKAMGLPIKSWSIVWPPPRNPFRYPREDVGLLAAFNEFAMKRPIYDRILGSSDGQFLRKYLIPVYTSDIAKYNDLHKTSYSDYEQVFLAGRVPENPLEGQDWEEFVREILPLEYIRLSPQLASFYRRFLAEKYASIEEYSRNRAEKYESFKQVPLSTSVPDSRLDQVDWEIFLKDRASCPVEGIEVYGPRQAFEQFVAERRGVSLDQITPIRLPIAAADWHDCMAQAKELRWEFTTRNYKQVFDYLLLHGHGIKNTIIYCSLAIGLALLVNPIAAYALSRYKPASTYKIILFLMATMAFPGEVTMIPAFLLLKRFPLWPLLAGGVVFGLTVWLTGRFLRQLSENARMLIALAVGLMAGALLLPAIMGKPHISLLNTFAALVLPGMANGYMIFLLKGFFDSLPRELYEAADIDGASEWTKFWSLTMGLSKPILAVIALGAFTGAYTQFMMALIIIPDQNMWTIMVWLFQLQSESHQSVMYASLVIAAIPALLVFVLCQGVIMRGIIVPTEK